MKRKRLKTNIKFLHGKLSLNFDQYRYVYTHKIGQKKIVSSNSEYNP